MFKNYSCWKCSNEISKSNGNEGLKVTLESRKFFRTKIYTVKLCSDCAKNFLDEIDHFVNEVKDHEAFENRYAKRFTLTIKKEY